MIRINLLAVERERARKRVVLIPAAHRVTVGATVILIGTAALIGWWFLTLRQQSAQLEIDLAQAETETRQIRSVLEQVRKFESQKAMLQQRVTLIEQFHPARVAEAMRTHGVTIFPAVPAMYGAMMQLPADFDGAFDGQGGATIYDYGQTSSFAYQPSTHFAYVGVNNSTDDTGSWPATYRNVWIGNKTRPASLGSALRPR